MSPDLPMSRRLALKLAAWGGAGLVVSACTRGVGPTTPKASVDPTTPELAPLPGRPANVRVSQDGFVAHAEPCLAVNPRDPRNLLGACIAHDDQGGTHIGAYASFDAGASWRAASVAWRTRPTAATPPSPSTPTAAGTSAPTPTTCTSGPPMTAAAPLAHRCWPPEGISWTTHGWPPTRPPDRHPHTCMASGPAAGQHPAGVRPVHRRRPQLPGPPRHRHRARAGRGRTSPPRWSRRARRHRPRHLRRVATAPKGAAAAGVSRPDQGRLLHRPRGELGPAGRARDRGDGDPSPARHQRARPAHGRGPPAPAPGRGRVRRAPAGHALRRHRGVPLPQPGPDLDRAPAGAAASDDTIYLQPQLAIDEAGPSRSRRSPTGEG